jgi:hypothetical protein
MTELDRVPVFIDAGNPVWREIALDISMLA